MSISYVIKTGEPSVMVEQSRECSLRSSLTELTSIRRVSPNGMFLTILITDLTGRLGGEGVPDRR